MRDTDVERSNNQLTARLKAGIARNLWGDAGFYTIILRTDPIFQRADRELAARNGVISSR
ncbi:MAG: hypothetical protein IPO17_00040 [Flavobacteriales bacterium]|nr:hypothetical protein [Flavobacteriales bacterium]